MSDNEPGHVTRTSPKNGSRPAITTAAPRPTIATPAAPPPAPPTIAVSFTSGLGILQRLRDTREVEARRQLEAMALAQIALTRDVAVRDLLPVVREWMRSPRNVGAEALFLSLLSAVRAIDPAQWERSLAFASTLAWAGEGNDLQLFLDLSIPGKTIASFVPARRLPKILAAITSLEPAQVDVGMIVRAAQDPNDLDRVEERWMSHATCEDLFIGGGIALEGLGGMALGFAGGPVGIIAGAVVGSFSGAANGAQLAGMYCAGYESYTADPGRSTGPFDPPPILEDAEGYCGVGVRGDWCWTFDPMTPHVPWGGIWPPRPTPMTPPFVPTLPRNPYTAYEMQRESAADPVDAVRDAMIRRSSRNIVIERLGPNSYLLHVLAQRA